MDRALTLANLLTGIMALALMFAFLRTVSKAGWPTIHVHIHKRYHGKGDGDAGR